MGAAADLIYQQSTSSGTGNLTLSALNGRRTFATAFGTGATTNVFDYFIMAADGSAFDEWERGTGHMSATNTLVRDTVLASSNGGSAVNFSGGLLYVTNAVPAQNIGRNDLAFISTVSGTGSNSAVQVRAATPSFALDATGSATDNKWWDFFVTGNQLAARVVNDAQSSATNWLTVVRSGISLASINLGAPDVTIGTSLYPVVSGANYDATSAFAANSIGAKNIVVGLPATLVSGSTWANTYEPGIDVSLANSIYSISLIGQNAGIFCARTSDAGLTGTETKVTQTVVVSDSTVTNFIQEGVMISGYVTSSVGSGFHHNNSFSYIANSAASVSADPFNAYPSGSTNTQLYASGNGGFVASPNNLTSVITVINNVGKFNSGIIFSNDALDSSVNPNPDALALPYNNSITWYASSGTKSWQIYSSSTANGNLNILSPGTGTVVLGNNITTAQSKNGPATIAATNSNTGSSAVAAIQLNTNAGTFNVLASSNAGGSAAQFAWSGAGPMLFDAINASGVIVFRTNAPTQAMKIFTSGGVSVGASAGDPGINNLKLQGSLALAAPVTLTGTSGTVGASDSSIIVNASGTFTLTLPAAATYPGRILNVKSIAAQTVNSASSNVVPIGTATAGTAILTNTAGKWARLHSDGTNWVTMEAN